MKKARTQHGERGGVAVQVLVVLVPVFFGFMGFAVDLGRLYLAKGELQSAANAMALAAASRLIGTDASIEAANASGRLAVENTGGFGNKYDFGGVPIGEGNGRLVSVLPEPTFYDGPGAARGDAEGGGDEADATTARYVRVDLTADAPLIFWGLLSLGVERKTPIAVRAVAGISAPVCTACGIEPIAIAPIDIEDSTGNFGFVFDTKYTLGYMCNGNAPATLQGTERRIPYLMLNRLNEEATLFPEESSQAYRIGAGGLPGSTTPARSCMTVGAQEEIWVSAAPQQCSTNRVPDVTRAFVCGLVSRFDPTVPEACESIAEVATIAQAYAPDSQVDNLETYTAYTGNLRRVITIPIVESLSPGAPMNILGFRQFLVQPDEGAFKNNETDVNGRFVVTYIGSRVPLKQGIFGSCGVTDGPGKVVLH